MNSNYQIVFVVGNGFDLSLGMKTSYKDFLNSDFFKDNLSIPSDANIYRVENLFNYLIHKKLENKGWIDIECELKKYALAQNVSIKDDSIIIPNQQNVSNQNIKDSYRLLEKSLLDYLNSIKDQINDNPISRKLLDTIALNEKNLIVTFNFTDIRKLISVDCNPNIHYMHGNLNGGNIILGIDKVDYNDENQKTYGYMAKNHHRYYNEFNLSNKLINADEVIIMGHSMGETDFQYFQDYLINVSKNMNNKKYLTIITKNQDSLDDIINNIETMTNTQYIKVKSNVVFNTFFTDEKDTQELKKLEDYISSVNKRQGSGPNI